MATRIKRYEERLERLDGLLSRIEGEMGPDAELTTREFRRGGFLGLGGRRMVEIIATLEISAEPQAALDAALPEFFSSSQDYRDEFAQPDVEYRLAQAASPADLAQARSMSANLEAPAPARHVDLAADEPAGMELIEQASVEAPQPAPLLPPPVEPESAPPKKRKTKSVARTDHGPPPTAPIAEEPTPPAPARISPVPLPEPVAAGAVDERSEISELKESIDELKQSIRILVEEVGSREAAAPAAAGIRPAAATVARPLSGGVADLAALDHGLKLGAAQRQVYDRLLDWNIGPYDAIELINSALPQWEGTGEPGEEDLIKLIFREICRGILLSGGIKLKSTLPGRAIALVGATGVGKTTTIAKLAAHFAFQQNRRVSLVSLDNYRIAAAEQLRTYTEIMGIDLDIVFSREEFDSVLTQRRQNDLVLIDTAGRSPFNTKQIYELKDIFAVHPPDEVHLVISASTKGDDLRAMLENFKPLSYDHIIISKLDETRSMGCLYNITKYAQTALTESAPPTPISYFTVGQSVPEDIRPSQLAFVQSWIEQGRIT